MVRCCMLQGGSGGARAPPGKNTKCSSVLNMFQTSVVLNIQVWFKRYDVLDLRFGLSVPFYMG